ncbi:DHH family phosphoesterase [Paenibacillus sp. SYP-B4298]|uniref:DHH family phosphoesterase n=1 Tax=Paenibacillus sp. SYP-B4298 TaxID=2996034 RepID=UPI0022DE7968|nr:bifunctional oligoribonuclease/PAP phosphatase NrnA [Paenibacillus sp. SYP-B4298]
MTQAESLYEQQLAAALAFVSEGDDFLVVSHVQPDGDAISSTVVVGWLLRQLGKRFTLINESELPSRLGFLMMCGDVGRYDEQLPPSGFTRVISVDCADYKRIGLVSSSFPEDVQLLNIDHHPTNDSFGSVNLIRSDAAATVEILYDLIRHAGLALDTEAATAIYTGLLTDTGGFRYANTSPHVMAIAAELLKLGVKGNELADHLLEKMTRPQLELLQRGLSRLSFTEDGRIGWLYIAPSDLEETGAASEDLEGLVNYARNVDGVEVGMLFKASQEGQTKVSLRSAGRVDVASIAQSFGGGGHVRAAGCRLDCGLQEAKKQVVEAVERVLM